MVPSYYYSNRLFDDPVLHSNVAGALEPGGVITRRRGCQVVVVL